MKPKLSVTDFIYRTGIHQVTSPFYTKRLEGVCEFWKPLPSLRVDFFHSFVVKLATAILSIFLPSLSQQVWDTALPWLVGMHRPQLLPLLHMQLLHIIANRLLPHLTCERGNICPYLKLAFCWHQTCVSKHTDRSYRPGSTGCAFVFEGLVFSYCSCGFNDVCDLFILYWHWQCYHCTDCHNSVR